VTPGGAALDTSAITISTDADRQCVPAAAFDGVNYLVVWADQIPEVPLYGGEDFTIYGRRVAQSGAPLDTFCFRIAPIPYGQFYDPFFPAIAFDGTNYLVVWQDRSIHASRVSSAGAVLDSPPILVSAGPTDISTAPAIAFDGTNYLVVWDDWRNGSYSDLYAARVNPNGQVLDTAGIVVSRAPLNQRYGAAAFDGTNYLVVWQDRRSGDFDIFASRVAPTGVVLDTGGIPVSRAPDWQTEPTVAFDGTNYLVFWLDARPSRPGAYCTRVTPAGVVLDTAGIYLASSFYGGGWSGTSVVFDGLNYFASWSGPRGISCADISPSAVVLDTPAIGYGFYPHVALGRAGRKLVVWDFLTDVVQGKPYRADRVWGCLSPFGGVAEERGVASRDLETSVFPNPAHSCFWIRSRQSLSRLAVYDAAGRLTYSVNCDRTAQSKERKVETENMTAGVYFVEVRTETETSRFKLVVE
jgi:hypothetical protein